VKNKRKASQPAAKFLYEEVPYWAVTSVASKSSKMPDPGGPQATAGVIDASVAKRRAECVTQDCISQAMKAVESNGMMMGTPK
jgi:hypothetical protein